MTNASGDTRSDRIADRRLLLFGIVVTGGFFSFGAAAQSMLVIEVAHISYAGHALHPVLEAALRFSIGLAAALIIGGCAVWWRLADRTPSETILLGIAAVLLASAARALLQLLFGVHPEQIEAVKDAIVALPIGLLVLGLGMALVSLTRRAREAERERRTSAVRAVEALDQLQQEELRVRREVADALHGTMQNRFLLIGARIGEAADAIEADLDERGAAELRERLNGVRDELDGLREHELRELSIALYPEALDRGIVPACRALVARIPRSIPVDLDIAGAPSADPFDRTARLLLVRVVEEGVSNALRHGEATELALTIAQRDDAYTIEVRHRGVEPVEAPRLSGLARLRSRLADLGGALELANAPGGGVLTARIPLP